MIHPPPARGVGLPAAVVAAVLAACAGYANLAYRVKDRADYRYFPPFQTGYNGNDNGHLGAEYFNIAKALVAGRGFADPFPAQTGPTAWMPPILPAVEAGLLWCAGGDKDVVIAAVVFLQTFTLGVTGLLVLALTRVTTRIGAWPAAAIFLLGVLCNFHLWFQFTHDCWIVLLALDLLIVGLVWFEPLNSNRAAAGWGLAGGLFALVSPIVGLTWGVLTVVSALRGRYPGHLRSRLAVAIVAAGLTLMPWTIRNYAVFGRLIPVKSNLAYELYQSQCLQRDGLLRNSTFKTHPIANLAARREYKALGEIAYLEHKGDEFRQAVRADPLDFLDRMASRLLGGTIWYVPIESDEEIKRPWVFWVSRIAHPLPFVGLLILIFAATRGPLAPAQWIVMAAYVVYLMPYVAVSYYERYAAPLLAVKVLLVLWGVDRVISGAYKNRPRLVQRASAVRPANGQGNNYASSTSRNRSDGILAMSRRTYLVLGLAVLGIAGSVFVFRPTRNVESTPGVDLVQDFRRSQQPADPWQLSGRGAAELVQPEEGGLRVTVPAGHTPNDPIGVVIGPIVRGDFDISCGYEIIQIEKPATGWGVGLELFVQTATPTQEAFALERMLRVNGADIYYCSRNTSLSGKREFHVKQFPAAGTTGRLRLTRAGRELTAWAADEKGEYQELGRYELGPEDLKLVRLAAHPGVAKNAVDVRIADVKVHYDPATVNTAASAPKPSTWGWLSRAEIIGMSVTLAFVGVWTAAPWLRAFRHQGRVVSMATTMPPGRFPVLATILVIAAVYAASIWANSSFAVTDSRDYRFLPPFQPHVNVNMNHHLGAEYFHIAQALAAGDGFANPFPGRSGPTAWMAPVLPAIEAGLLWAFGGSRDAVMAGVVFLQVNTLILTGILVVAVVRKTTGRLAGWLTVFVFLAAVCSDFHSWFQFTHDCWLVLLALDFMVIGLVWLRPRPTWAAAIGWGLIGGFGAMVSPIVGFVWGMMTLISGRYTGRLRFRIAVGLLTAGLVVAPWTIRNFAVFGRLIPVKSNAAYELYQSQCLQPDGLIRTATFSTHPNNAAGGRERQEYQELGEMAFLDHKQEQFWQAVRADPQNFLDRVADRLLGTTVWYVPFNADEPKRRPWVYHINRIVYPLPFLAAVFLTASAVRRPLLPVQWAVLGVYVLYLLPYVAVSFYNRYGVPLLAVNVLLMVWAGDRVASLGYKRRTIQDAATVRQRPAGLPAMARSVVSLVALTGLATVAQSASAADGPEPGVFRADFGGKPFDERLVVKVIGKMAESAGSPATGARGAQ